MDHSGITFPVPAATEMDRPFWEGIQKEVLSVQKCRDCGQLQFFPRPVCVNCFSTSLGWDRCRGTGKIYTFTVVNVPTDPAMRKYVQETKSPFILAIIELEEGVRMMSEIVDSKPDQIRIGAPVTVAFRQVRGADFKLPVFRIAK
jgi:uncharacterized protein